MFLLISLMMVVVVGVNISPCGDPPICLCNIELEVVICTEGGKLPSFPFPYSSWRVVKMTEPSTTDLIKHSSTTAGINARSTVDISITGHVYFGIQISFAITASLTSVVVILKLTKMVREMRDEYRRQRDEVMGMRAVRREAVVLGGEYDVREEEERLVEGIGHRVAMRRQEQRRGNPN